MEPQPVAVDAGEPRVPTWARTAIVGPLLGAMMALLGSVLMLAVVIAYFWLTVPNLRALIAEMPHIVLDYYSVLVPIMAFFSVPLGMVGGVFVALALRERAQRGWLSRRSSVALGIGIGAASGASLTLLELLFLGSELIKMPTRDLTAIGVFTMVIATLAGGVHAWRIDRWLRQHGATRTAPVR